MYRDLGKCGVVATVTNNVTNQGLFAASRNSPITTTITICDGQGFAKLNSYSSVLSYT